MHEFKEIHNVVKALAHITIVTMVLKTFVPSVHQTIEVGIEEIRIKSVQSHQGGWRNSSIGFETAATQLLIQTSEEMKVS